MNFFLEYFKFLEHKKHQEKFSYNKIFFNELSFSFFMQVIAELTIKASYQIYFQANKSTLGKKNVSGLHISNLSQRTVGQSKNSFAQAFQIRFCFYSMMKTQ